MSEIKNVGYTWMAKCNQMTTLPFKGLTECAVIHLILISFLSLIHVGYWESSLSAVSHRERGGWLCTWLCLSVCLFVIISCKQDIWNLFIDLCKLCSRHCIHTAMEMVNFWCRSHSRWLTFSHFSFSHKPDRKLSGSDEHRGQRW